MNFAQLRRDVRRYLATGEHDPMGMMGAGSMLDGFHSYGAALREALLAAVQRCERGHTALALPPGFNPTAFAEERLAPMVNGLFPVVERPVVLSLLTGSIVFLTPAATYRVLAEADLGTAWTIANVYLHSLGAKELGREDIAGDGPHGGCR